MDSVEWLAREVWAKVADKLPNVEMHVYGAYPSNESCVNRTELDRHCARPPAGWWPVLQQFHGGPPSRS